MYDRIERTLDTLFSLSNTPRISILMNIYSKPNISFLELKYRLNVSRNKLYYHLNILTSNSYIVTHNNRCSLVSWVLEFLEACHMLAHTYNLTDTRFLYQINGIKRLSCLTIWDYLFHTNTSPTIDEMRIALDMDKTSLRKYIVRSTQAQFMSQSIARKKSLRRFQLTQKGVDTFLMMWQHLGLHNM